MKIKLPFLSKLNISLTKKSVFRYFLISYIAVFLVPVVISVLMYSGTIDISRKETVDKNLIICEQFKYSAEQVLIRIENIRARINADKKLCSLDYKREDISPYERYTLLTDISNLKDYILTENDFIDSIYLYRSDFNLALGTNGLYSLNRLYTTIFASSSLEYSMLDDMLKMNEGIYIPYREQNINGFEEECILCILPVGREIYSSNWSHILMTITKDRFKGKIETSNSNADIFIIDKNNEIISLYGNTDGLALDYNELINSENTITRNINGRKNIVTYLNSDLTDWKYVMCESASSYLGRIHYIRNILIWGLILAFLIGLVIILRFTGKNYGEIKKIADLFGSKDKEDSENELEFINKEVLKSLNIKEQFDELLRKKDIEKKDLFLIDLLKGVNFEALSCDDYKKEISGTFDNDCFLVVVLAPDEIDNIYFGEESPTLTQKREEAHFIVANTMEDVFGAKVTSIDGIIGAVINKNNLKCEDIYTKLQELLEFYKNDFNIVVTAALGSIQKGANAIGKSYSDAHRALQYRFLFGKGSAISYDDIRKAGGNAVYSHETEQTLINCVKIGDFEQISEIINELFEMNFKDKLISVEMAKCFVFDIVSTVLKIIPKTDEGEFVIDKLHIVNNLMTSDTVAKMKENLLLVFDEICKYQKVISSDASQNISKEITKYIDANFTDRDINVTKIAQNFNLSGAYISKLYKAYTGIGILDYIHMQRISYAKELLKAGVNVALVAEKAGYNNSNAFIRVFKKYEKITPGQYI